MKGVGRGRLVNVFLKLHPLLTIQTAPDTVQGEKEGRGGERGNYSRFLCLIGETEPEAYMLQGKHQLFLKQQFINPGSSEINQIMNITYIRQG